MTQSFQIIIADWPRDAEAIRVVRERVFIQEQGIPAALEWDGRDPTCRHVLALSAAQAPIGTGRLLPSGQIGRMCVLAQWRQQHVGAALLQQLIALENTMELFLHAQSTVIDFYRKYGFAVEGPVFYEADIAHQKMRYHPS